MDDDVDVALTRKAIKELMSGSAGNGIQHERKLNPLGRPNPNKRFLDRTLNSAIKYNKRELARSQVNSREKLRELDEHEKRRAQNSFYRSSNAAGYTRPMDLKRNRSKQTNANSPRSRSSSSSSSSSSNSRRNSRSRNRNFDSNRHHRKKIGQEKKHKYEKYKRRSRSFSRSRSRSISNQSYKQSPHEYIEQKVSTVPQYANNDFARMQSYFMHSNSTTFASIASMALAFGHMQEAMQIKNSSVTENLQEDKEDDRLSDKSTTNSSLLGELSLSESSSEDENENEMLTIDISSSDDLESLTEGSNSSNIKITKESNNFSDSCISLGSDDDIDELANTVQNKPKESVVVELSSDCESSRTDLKVVEHIKFRSEEETVDLTEN